MRTRASIAYLFPLVCLLGCTLPYTPPSLTGNWQIQAGTAITSPPNTYPNFVGALQEQGTQVSAIFSTAPNRVSPQVINFTGSFNPTTESLAFNSNFFEIGFTDPSTPYTITPVTVIGGCFNPITTNVVCPAVEPLFPSVGVQIAPLNGTYTGTLTVSCPPNTSSCPAYSGTGTLTLTQSTTPNSSGQFPLTGTITFPSSSGFGTHTISGTISGEGIILYDPTPGIVPVVSLTASTNPSATQITVSNLAFAVTASDIVTYTGTLVRQ